MSRKQFYEQCEAELERDAKNTRIRCQEDIETIRQLVQNGQKAIQQFIDRFFDVQIQNLEECKANKQQNIKQAMEAMEIIKEQSTMIANMGDLEQRQIQRLKEQIATCKESSDKTIQQINKRIVGINQTNVEIEKLVKASKQSQSKSKLPISINPSSNELVVRVNKNLKEFAYTLKYLAKQDRFRLLEEVTSNINKVVNEFNFHRDIRLLYEGLYYFTE